jgi:dTDP-L-rhamnose 4-epimerase
MTFDLNGTRPVLITGGCGFIGCNLADRLAAGGSNVLIIDNLARVMGRPELTPTVTGKYRAGDIRHCFADLAKSRKLLGFEPRVSFDHGLAELARYLGEQIADDQAEKATQELLERGLVA